VTTLLIFVALVVFVIVATALWGMIVDGTIHRPPSEWVASVYLGVLVGGLSAASLLLDFIRLHLLFASIVGIATLATLIWVTILFWRKVKKWDESYYARQAGSPRYRSS
jgi:hypothetical protein